MRKIAPLLCIVLVFILSAVCMVRVYEMGKKQSALMYADIPPETIDWLTTVGGELGDLLATFNPKPRTTPWGNDADFGRDGESGFLTLEDEYFIIYFPESMRREADICRRFAHSAIPRLKEIVGRYYYPEDMNGRKVPIYLTTDTKSYIACVSKFSARGGEFTNTAAVTCQEISPSGSYLKGIVVNGSSAFSDIEFTQHVIWHELTHYCFFASIDYNQRVNLQEWCIEGIAEYTGYPNSRPSFTVNQIETLRRECLLSDRSFPKDFENYQGGNSIFCFMEDEYQVKGVSDFLQVLFRRGIPASLDENFSTDLASFERSWKENLERFQKE